MAKAKKQEHDLPPDVLPADLEYKTAGKSIPYEKLKELGLDYSTGWYGLFKFYKTQKSGWILCTLPIRAASRHGRSQGQTDRTYGVDMRGQVHCVGIGPHVVKTVEVRLTVKNLKRLMKYVELWKKGMASAGVIRDRISTRRAQTISRRGIIQSPWWM